MSDTYHRGAYASFTPAKRKRLCIIAIIILCASALWHSVDGLLIYQLGCSSVGYFGEYDTSTPTVSRKGPARHAIIAAALRWKNPDLPQRMEIGAHTLPRPGWVSASWTGRKVGVWRGHALRRPWMALANHRLELKGRCVWLLGPAVPPGDVDGDALWEILLWGWLHGEDGKPTGHTDYVALRLGHDVNEVVGYLRVDDHHWGYKDVAVQPIWRDEDDDGQRELAFVTVEFIIAPSGQVRFKPPRTVAVFDWSAPGGILVPRRLHDDGSITFWKPPDGKPKIVGQEADLYELFRRLLPLPASRPATRAAATSQTRR